MPIFLAIAAAVDAWSPVIITTFIPARRQSRTADADSGLGGSASPASPQKINLCADGSEGGEPLQVYDVYTHLLPESDVAALQKGIPVESEERLDRLLEDFGA